MATEPASSGEAPALCFASRRDTERKSPSTGIKVFSNGPQVTLKLNGKSLGEASRVADHVFLLKDPTGENRIEAEGSVNGKPVKDSCQWTYHK